MMVAASKLLQQRVQEAVPVHARQVLREFLGDHLHRALQNRLHDAVLRLLRRGVHLGRRHGRICNPR